jgi:chromosome segregation ATPase
VQQLRAEVAELQGRTIQIDRAAFSDLGPMVEQMLTLAEKQAAAIVGHATQRAASREAEADKLLNEARERAAHMTRDLETQLVLRRKTADKAHDDHKAAAEAELAQVRQEVERVRAKADSDREQAEQEAQRLAEQNERHVDRARAEARALVDAARTEAAQELASKRAELDREIGERRAEAAQKIAALHAQAQLQADELHKQLNAQAAAHQQQMDILSEKINAQRQTLGEIQAELAAADQRLAQSGHQQSTIDREVAQLQQRLGDVGQALETEIQRLEQARRAGAAAEQHAREVRLRVQREAQRVAERAAAAVLAAAAGGGETGEFPQIVLESGTDGNGDPNNGHPAERGSANGTAYPAGNGLPVQRGPRPAPAVGTPAPAAGPRDQRQPTQGA